MPLPPADNLPPAEADGRPYQYIENRRDQADGPPRCLFGISRTEVNRAGRRAEMGQARTKRGKKA